MEPNFYTQDYLIVDELSYRFRTPERYEVIVFKAPNHPGQYYIKRIVGLPGETVEIRSGQILINNSILDESEYFSKEILTQGNIKIKLDQDKYFVLGDNRKASSDSRQWGALPQDNIIGQVWIRAWPFNQAEVF